MYDTVLRMIDAQGDEVAAAEDVPAAQRNRLMRAIDPAGSSARTGPARRRRSIASSSSCRPSRWSIRTLVNWPDESGAELGRHAAHAVFQVSEENATQYLTQTQELAEGPADGPPLRRRELRHRPRFGPHPRANADGLLKIDGSLMQSIATDQVLQEKVRLRARQRIAHDSDDRRARRGTPTRWPCYSSSAWPTCRATTSTSRSALGLARRYSALSRSTVRQPPGRLPRRPRSPA